MATYLPASMSPFANPMRRPRPQVRPAYNKGPMMMPGGINLQDLLPNEANPYLGGPQGTLMDLMNRPQPVRPGPRPMGPPGGSSPFPGNFSPPGGEGFLDLNKDQLPILVFQPPEMSGAMPPPRPTGPDPRPMGPPTLSQPFPVPDANTFDASAIDLSSPQFSRPNFGGPQPFGGFGGIGSFLRPYMPPSMPGPYGGGFGGGFGGGGFGGGFGRPNPYGGGGFGGGFGGPNPYGGGFGFGGGFGRPNPYGGGFGGGFGRPNPYGGGFGGGFGRPNPYGGGFGGGGFGPFGGGFGPNINNMTSSFGTRGGFQQGPSGGFGLGPNGTGLGPNGSAYMGVTTGGPAPTGGPVPNQTGGITPYPNSKFLGSGLTQSAVMPNQGAVGQAAPQQFGGGAPSGLF